MTIKGIVVSCSSGVSKNNSPYQVVSVVNPEGRFQVSVWAAKLPYKRRTLITFKDVKDADGFLSCTVSSVTTSVATEEWLSLLPQPVSEEDWNKVVYALAELMHQNNQADCFISAALRLRVPYSTATAARVNHHNFEGGLLTHTYELLNIFLHIYPALPFTVNPFIVAFSALYHDFGKLSEYDENFDYRPALFLQGHSFLSAEAAGRFLRKYSEKVPLSTKVDSLIQHIQHCILAHHGRLEFGAPVLPCSPEAFLVAKLDELSGIGVQFDKPSGSKINSTTIQRFDD